MVYSAPDVDFASTKNNLGVFARSKVVELCLNLLCKSWNRILTIQRNSGEKVPEKIVTQEVIEKLDEIHERHPQNATFTATLVKL